MSSEMRELMQSVLDFVNRQPCRCMSIAQLGERDYCERCQSVKNLRALLARTEAAPVADGAVAYQHREAGTEKWYDCSKEYYDTLQKHPWDRATMRRQELRALYTHPQDASGDAAPVLFGRDSGGDWYVDTDTKSICVDVDFDPARQLSLVLKQDGSVAWSIFVQEPDSSATKATGPSVMNPGFYEALSYIAMQAKEAK